MFNSRSVSVDLDRVDAVLGEAAALQEGTVVADLHALTGEITGFEQLDAVVLAVLTEKGQMIHDTLIIDIPPSIHVHRITSETRSSKQHQMFPEAETELQSEELTAKCEGSETVCEVGEVGRGIMIIGRDPS